MQTEIPPTHVHHHWTRKRLFSVLIPATSLLLAVPAYASSDPWENAVTTLKTAFTGTIATCLSLVAIVVGGLMFAYGEGQSKLWRRHGDWSGELHVLAFSVIGGTTAGHNHNKHLIGREEV
jgi:type IV secretory pathway VirB2 component (pilin)